MFKKKTQSLSPGQEKFSKPIRFFPDPVIPINNEPSLNCPGLIEWPGWAEKGVGPFLKSPENLQAKKAVVGDIQ